MIPLRLNSSGKKQRVDHAATLYWQLKAAGLGDRWHREHRFHATRQWRFDLADPERKLAVEVEGFAAGGAPGRHQRVGGFQGDIEKYAEAWAAGWRVLRVTSKFVNSGQALAWIERGAPQC